MFASRQLSAVKPKVIVPALADSRNNLVKRAVPIDGPPGDGPLTTRAGNEASSPPDEACPRCPKPEAGGARA